MSGAKLFFASLFLIGSFVALGEWIGAREGILVGLSWLGIAGHGLQVLGAFGMLLIPERKDGSDNEL
jgi:hypothetical protein